MVGAERSIPKRGSVEELCQDQYYVFSPAMERGDQSAHPHFLQGKPEITSPLEELGSWEVNGEERLEIRKLVRRWLWKEWEG